MNVAELNAANGERALITTNLIHTNVPATLQDVSKRTLSGAILTDNHISSTALYAETVRSEERHPGILQPWTHHLKQLPFAISHKSIHFAAKLLFRR